MMILPSVSGYRRLISILDFLHRQTVVHTSWELPILGTERSVNCLTAYVFGKYDSLK